MTSVVVGQMFSRITASVSAIAASESRAFHPPTGEGKEKVLDNLGL
jgi:hypothetical protein